MSTRTRVFLSLSFAVILSLLLYGGILMSLKHFKPAGNPIVLMELNGDRLYYQNFNDGYRLYRSSLQGEDRVALSKSPISGFVIDEEQIYFSNGYAADENKRQIIVTDLNGKVQQQLNHTDAERVWFVADGWIFYSNEKGIFRTQKHKKDVERIADFAVRNVILHQGNIYFSTLTEQRTGLYKVNFDGQNLVRLYADDMPHFAIDNDLVIFPDINDAYLLHVLDLVTLEVKPLISEGTAWAAPSAAFAVVEGELYYTNELANEPSYLYVMNLRNRSLTRLVKLEATTIKAYSDYLFLYHPANGGKLTRLDLKTLEQLTIKKK